MSLWSRSRTTALNIKIHFFLILLVICSTLCFTYFYKDYDLFILFISAKLSSLLIFNRYDQSFDEKSYINANIEAVKQLHAVFLLIEE